MARKPKKMDVEEALVNMLKTYKKATAYNLDLIKDYMNLYDIKNKLIRDIKTRGVTVQYDNGGGQKGIKKNDSTSELLKTNAQMLKILCDLGVKDMILVMPEDEDM